MTGIIYKATNLINGKVYIGQTIKKFKKRIIEHISAAKNDNGYVLHDAIAKYGTENFKWEVLERCNRCKLNIKEVSYIKEYNSYYGYGLGYNMTFGGDSKGITTPETRENIRLSKLGEKNPNFGKRGPGTTSYGYAKTKKWLKLMKELNTGEGNPMYGRVGALNHRSKKYSIITPSGTHEEIVGLREYCRTHDLNPNGMMLVAKNKKKEHRGYICSYYMED